MKQYHFQISAAPAEFKDGCVSIKLSVLSGDNGFFKELFTGTLAQAVARRAELSAGEARPHAAFLSQANRADRKPAGFDAASKVLYGNKS